MTVERAIEIFETLGYMECHVYKYPYFRKDDYVCAITKHSDKKVHLNWFHEWQSDIRFQGLVGLSTEIITLSNLLVID